MPAGLSGPAEAGCCRGGLAEAGAALCIADTEETTTPLVATAPFGYLRLRRPGYDEGDLARWVEWIRAQPFTDAFVFFKHEDEARGPEYALAMAARVAADAGRSIEDAGAP